MWCSKCHDKKMDCLAGCCEPSVPGEKITCCDPIYVIGLIALCVALFFVIAVRLCVWSMNLFACK